MSTYFRPGTYALVPNKHLLPQMKGAPLSVYVVLCSHMDDQGICFPGVARLTTMTGYSRTIVFRALKVLIGLGVIERHNRFSKDSGQDSNLYRMLIADYPQGSVADDTGEYRTRHGGGVADDTGGSVVHDTLRGPIELNQLRNKNGVDKGSRMTESELRAAGRW